MTLVLFGLGECAETVVFLFYGGFRGRGRRAGVRVGAEEGEPVVKMVV